ncbi:SMI1/KNR4 family protein [Chitinimonas lacunae]|uniref:SMI1/KNR4 family protein n=1 Tax=Chitinimonas lacunae TaxID=1963018 RepID=A0ABV8MJV5_9NEIS
MVFAEKIIAAGLNEERAIVGLSNEEILEVERAQGVRLPAAYRSFLKECGKSAGLFERDADFFYPAIKTLKDELNEMLAEENMDFRIPENAFVFSAYQGYQYCYFLCGEEENPPVYRVDDGEGNFIMISESFTQHIDKAIAHYKGAFFQE